MGEGAFFISFGAYLGATFVTRIIRAKMIAPRKSNAPLSEIFTNPKMILIRKISAVAKIRPTTQGRTPPRNAFTPLYFKRSRIRAEMIRMMTNEGRTTPRVATTEPKNPACVEPTKVAIFTAIGPGVDSATAIIFRSSASVSQPCASVFSRIIDIIP